MNYILLIAIAVVGYLLGSLSISIMISQRALGEDIRKLGSGNAGATNMARVYGWGAGALTLAGDCAKAGLAMLAGYLLYADMGLALGGIACMFGHCFPAFHNFRGGKGVSVGAAVALAIDWRVFLVVIAVFIITALAFRKVSLASVCAALMIVIASLAFSVSVPRFALACFGMVMVLIRHKDNIKRLLNGTEPDFHAGKSKTKKKNTD